MSDRRFRWAVVLLLALILVTQLPPPFADFRVGQDGRTTWWPAEADAITWWPYGPFFLPWHGP